ncbi:MAG TPA: capsular polysaccharide biosynthesis protein CapF [Lachnospiraceae bacterium]|nr:capsular polysaccharide biosynthesis protein CapF [Lachnospiraceae bacterium]
MNILVTGANGFIGKNLILELENAGYSSVYPYDVDTKEELLDDYARCCDFVFHLAGVNRPKDEKEFMEGNFGFTSVLLEKLKKYHNPAPILITSSIQAQLDNPYGKSKRAGEELLLSYAEETGARVIIYRLPNVFGKWCRPNYNSVVATFCHNIANGLDIRLDDPKTVMNLVYIDDVIREFFAAMDGKEHRNGDFSSVPAVHTVRLGEIAESLYRFRNGRSDLSVPNLSNEFEKKLYSTYLSYLPKDDFSYPLHMHTDERGSFTEFLRTPDRGQVSVNISRPGVTKGNHWHHTKCEKFLVVKGTGCIRFRKIGEEEIITYHVSDKNLTVVDIPTGYTHSITNEGDTDMITVMWANEAFDPDRPDTYFEKVEVKP